LNLPPGSWNVIVRAPAETPAAKIEDVITVELWLVGRMR
jgi:hypothetical protein